MGGLIMTNHRGSTAARPASGAPEQLFDLTQEHIRPLIGLIDRLNEVGAEDEVRVIAKQLTRLSTGRSRYPCGRRQKTTARQAAEAAMSKVTPSRPTTSQRSTFRSCRRALTISTTWVR